MKKLIIESAKHGVFEVLIDDEDYPKTKNHTWHIIKAHNGRFYVNTHVPHPNGGVYTSGRDKGRRKRTLLQLHRFILNAPKGKMVDHINGNPLDNQKANLRLVTHRQNSMNQTKTRTHKGKKTSSRYRGVGFQKNPSGNGGRWIARIGVNGRTLQIGSFKTEEEAAKAWDNEAKKLFGEFARLNFPSFPE